MFKCQACETVFKQPFAGPCPECDSNTLTVIGKRIPDLTNEQMQANLTEWMEHRSMTNLEYMHKYQVEKLNISDMSDSQLAIFREEKLKGIELDRIRIQAAEHLLRERGKAVKMQLKESDLTYIVPAEAKMKELERTMGKKGESAAKIEKVKAALLSDDFFDDI